MSDSRAKRASLGALRVDVYPLVVSGGIGKLVHLLLGDGDPFAGNFALAYKLGDALECFKNFHVATLANKHSSTLGGYLLAIDIPP